MELRHWLLILCGLAILLIFLDGYRRWRERPKYKGSYTKDEGETVEYTSSSELPNGGARVRTLTPQEILERNEKLKLGEKVPVLMEAMASQQTEARHQAGETEKQDAEDAFMRELQQSLDLAARHDPEEHVTSEKAHINEKNVPPADPEPQLGYIQTAQQSPQQTDYAPQNSVAADPESEYEDLSGRDWQLQGTGKLNEDPVFVNEKRPEPAASEVMPELPDHTAGQDDLEFAIETDEPAAEEKADFVSATHPQGHIAEAEETTAATESVSEDADPETTEQAETAESPAPEVLSPFARFNRTPPFQARAPLVDPEPVSGSEPETAVAAEPAGSAVKEETESEHAGSATPMYEAGLGQDLNEPKEVIVINVFSEAPDGFDGEQLLHILLACGMRFGAMNIFHRADDGGQLQFSMANSHKPGAFDIENMGSTHIPGVSFFMTLPNSADAMQSFEYMYETANVIAKHMDGVLKDELLNVMRGQTVEHCRQRIRDFARSQLLHA